MKILFSLNWLLPVALLLTYSCSTSSPDTFGNRKFYPDSKNKIVRSAKKSDSTISLIKTFVHEKQVGESTACTENLQSSGELKNQNSKVNELKELIATKGNRFARKFFNRTLASAFAKNQDNSSTILEMNDDKKTPGISIAGFVLGVLSLFILPFVFGLLAVIFSGIGLSKDSSSYKKGLAIAGLILGILGVIYALVVASK